MSNKFIVLSLLIVCFTGILAWIDFQEALNTPAINEKTVYLEINKGDSLNRIADKLAILSPVIRPIWFKAIAVKDNSEKILKTGEYELTPGLTLPEIVELIAQGKTKQYAITFPEGWRFKDILKKIDSNPNLEHTLKTLDIRIVLQSLGANPDAPEGLFFPDTYYFEKHMTDVSLLKRAYIKMQSVLQEEWSFKTAGLPFKNAYEALTLASIIEKETGVENERPLIAGVFIRRLQTGMPLQTDPTVIYGMGDSYTGNISSGDLKTATPYNTYLFKGLPPTPIAMPGRRAINAALHPDNGDSLYFVAKGDGTHMFSATMKDHNQAVDQFQIQKK